ncbi:hypothetical protein APY94_03800 [Thermococcus celericrescens]|uniref:Restriction endonuclease n=1 Tax=Thermococcus celericrescens TaxID=227598 RepID=A0A100XYL5_9EURY|nr:hypothetical protein [Thermococcus celericrescens]KUH34007.1 hypothetical protein APY94_03800 [Thermococcus celericrescens]
MASLKILTLYEHDKVSYFSILQDQFKMPEDKAKDQKIIDEHLAKPLRRLNEFFAKNPPKSTSNDSPEEEDLDKDKGFLLLYGDSLKARHYVGFGTSGNLLVQVLPKIFKPKETLPEVSKPKGKRNQNETEALLAFIRMLNVAYGLKIRDVELAHIEHAKVPNSILEIFIHLFAKSLWEEVQRGYYREYQEIQQEEKFLRGKLLLSRQIKKLPHQRHTFSVELHEFSEDNPLNQIFYATIRFSLSKTRWLVNKKLLGELMMVFDGVSPRKVTKADFNKVHFNRLNERFKKPFNLAKIILKSFGGVSGEEVSGFFVDMNELFERFILWILKRDLPEYKIEYQKELSLFDRKQKSNVVTTKQYPDFVINKIVNRNTIPVGVLDAKYRPIEIKEGKIQIGSDMLRQVYVYSKILEKEHDIKEVPTALVFPRSFTYNPGITLDDQAILGGATFFDGGPLLILMYDMETLKKGLKMDKNFRKSLIGALSNSLTV